MMLVCASQRVAKMVANSVPIPNGANDIEAKKKEAWADERVTFTCNKDVLYA